MTGTDYAINYEDERFTKVEADKNEALTEVEKTYGDMIGQSDSFYQQQIDASKQWADKQSQLQQEQTDFAIEQIEQQKEQSQKDYVREQAGAYTDWQKQSNPYGAAAEKMAASGLTGTGFSESSQVSMYNTYQNRVATARESYNRAILNYNNAIKDARLQNNAALAEIAFQALQQQLELSLQGFQYKNSLILDQANKKMEVDNMYYNRYQDVLQQINNENALAEQIRQYNQNYELQMKQFEESIRQFNEEIARLKANDARAYSMQIKELELKKQQLEEEKRQFDLAYGDSGNNTAYTDKSGTSGGLLGNLISAVTGGVQSVISNAGKSGSPVASNDDPNTLRTKTYEEARAASAHEAALSAGPHINWQSVYQLGYGKISESELTKLREQGKVKSYIKDGEIYFTITPGNSPHSTYLTGGASAAASSNSQYSKYLTG